MSLATIPEASEALKISKRHLWHLVKSQQIPYTRISQRTIRVDLEQLKAITTPGGEGQQSYSCVQKSTDKKELRV